MSENSHKKQMVSGVVYSAIAKYSGLVIQLGIAGVLGRLLSPDDFGVVATATLMISFFAIFTDMGLGAGIIQHKDLSKTDLDNIFSFTCWTGLLLAALFFAGSWPISAFFKSPQLVPVCQILSLNLLFSSLNIVPNGLINRDKKFKFMATRTLAVQLSTGVAAIVVALFAPKEYKIYALVVQTVLSVVLIFVVNLRLYRLKLRMTLGLESLRGIFSYSAYQFLFTFINFFSRNVDKMIVGKYLSMSQLGYYEKSYRLMMLPLQNITFVLTPVMHPIFSEMRHDLRILLNNYMKVVRLLALIGFPLSVMLFFCGRELMLLLFGEQWGPSVPVFCILAFSVGVQIVLSSSGSIFQAANDTRALFYSGLVSAVVNVSGMVTALMVFGTMEAMAVGIVITFAINFVITYVVMFRVTFKKTPMGMFWKQLLSPLALSGLLFGVLWVVSLMPEQTNMFLSLGVKGVVGGAIWLAYIQFTGEFDIIGKAKSILKR